MTIQTTGSIFEHELRRLLERNLAGCIENLTRAPFETIGGFERVRGRIDAYREVFDSVISEAAENTQKRINT